VVGKSPLTGTWGDSSSGGNFGPYLRFAGYDAVFFTGLSEKPVYLLIDNGKAEIRDADRLWGKDTHETEDILKQEHGNQVEVACIGPSGEKVSLIAAIMTDKGRAAGRSGLGAVMGSKKLKAVVVKGAMKVPVLDADRIAALRKEYRPKLVGLYEEFHNYGTPAVVVPFAKIGDAPVKNWDGVCETDFPQIENLNIDAVMSRVQKKYGCYRCVVACGGLMKESTGEHRYEAGVHKPEYETISMFGTNCLNDNIESIIKANDICNRYGLDTISAGACISFAIDLYEHQVITKEDTGGIEMTWGNHQSIIAMLEKIARREGFGDVLAAGTRVAARKIGRNAEEYTIHYHGQEPPAHNPKLEYGFASAYRMDATPARHSKWHAVFVPKGVPVPEYPPGAWTGRGEAQKINVMFNHAVEGFGLCLFVLATYPHVDVLVGFLKAATGWDITVEEILKTGERIGTLRHLFNLREGLNPLTYSVSGRITGAPPAKEGPLAGVTIDEESVNREFLEAMDWDLKTTRPSQQKLRYLGLDEIA
jgi:aldehyde:ferredoxin oxidoreductase